MCNVLTDWSIAFKADWLLCNVLTDWSIAFNSDWSVCDMLTDWSIAFNADWSVCGVCRNMLMATCMTASDLCSMYKEWDLQLKLVYIIMEEFWQQVSCPISYN